MTRPAYETDGTSLARSTLAAPPPMRLFFVCPFQIEAEPAEER